MIVQSTRSLDVVIIVQDTITAIIEPADRTGAILVEPNVLAHVLLDVDPVVQMGRPVAVRVVLVVLDVLAPPRAGAALARGAAAALWMRARSGARCRLPPRPPPRW
eukprot:1706128-Pyramimonas_sp.AAC.1